MNQSVWLRVAGFKSKSKKIIKSKKLLINSPPSKEGDTAVVAEVLSSSFNRATIAEWPVEMPVMGHAGDECSPCTDFSLVKLFGELPLITASSCSWLTQQSCPGEQGGISNPLPCPLAFATDAAYIFQMHPLEACALRAYSRLFRKSDGRASWKYHLVMGYFSKSLREAVALSTEGDAF